MAFAPAGAAFAQDAAAPPEGATPSTTTRDLSEMIDFTAGQVSYDSKADLITASGQVRMSRDGNYLAADSVTWDRNTGEVRARGNVVVLSPEGDKLVGDDVVLTDTFRDGTIDNLLIVLESGGRIAARRGIRTNNITTLENAIYSPCPVTTPNGCPKRPSWSITAARVIHDPAQNRVRFRGGRLQLFGVTLSLLPVFSIGTGQDNGGISGWLVPDISLSSRNGVEIAASRYWRLAPNRDLTITPHIYTGALPAIEARYRDLNSIGAFQLGGFLTYGRIDDVSTLSTGGKARNFRGDFEGNGKA